MRKKQVLALLLTGALSVGMAPSAVFAAEDAGAVAIEDVQTAAFEEPEGTAEETPEAAAPETPAEPTDVPAETPTEAPAQPAETPTEAPAETPTEAPAEAPAAGTPAETPVQVPAELPEGNLQAQNEEDKEETQTKPFTLGANGYDTLEEAIAASTAVSGDTADIIYINQDCIIESATVISTGKNVILAAPVGKNVNITRKAGFKGNMFEVKGGELQLGYSDVDSEGNDVYGNLVINGKGEETTGSIVSVSEDGSLGLLRVTLTENSTTANGAAINCAAGSVVIADSSITGNSTSGEGGAIYSESTVYVGGNINVSGNIGANGAVSNIMLKNDVDAVINVYDAVTTATPIGVRVSNPGAGIPVVTVSYEDSEKTPEEILSQTLTQFTYEDTAYTFDEAGALKSTETPVEKLEVKITGEKWLSTNRVQINGTSTKSGDAYMKVVKKGAKAPTAEEIIKANQKLSGGVTANKEFTFAHTFSADEKKEVGSDAATVYICIRDAAGETAVASVDMNVTARPPKVTGVQKGTGWTGHNSANIVCISDKAGSYYWGWSVRSDKSTSASSKAPEIDFTKEGVPVAANTNFTVYANDLDSDSPIDVYVYVKGEDGSISAPVVAKLSEDNRPANPTEAPSRNPITPSVSESRVTGLEEPLEFYPNTFYDFTVIGAGTQNTDPIEGDTRWVPLYWSMSSNPADSDKHSSWKIGAKGGIKSADTYNMYIFFRQDRYNGREWQPTDSIVSQVYQFRSAEIDFSLSPTPTIIPGTDGYDEYGNPIERTDDGTDTGSSTAYGANTADESPTGAMSMLAVLSLLAGGYVVTRKRKKVTD